MQTKKTKRNKRKSLIILGSFLIILSFSILFLKYFNLYKNDEKEKKSLENFYIKEEVINKDIKEEKVEQTKSSNYDYIAVLRIPKINLKKGLVSKNSKYNNIEYNVTIHELSSRPDEINGNVILMAHSGTAYISYFNNLKYLNINDHIYLDYNNKTYNYKITNIYDVEKTGSLNIKRNNNKSTITLITCRDNSNKQIVIIGEIELIVIIDLEVMFMNNIDYEELNDEEFHKIFEEFDKKMDEFLEKEDFYNRYIAYFIAEEYKEKLLPKISLDTMIISALNSIEVVRTSKDKIKEHLKNKYKLELIDEDNLTFKEL